MRKQFISAVLVSCVCSLLAVPFVHAVATHVKLVVSNGTQPTPRATAKVFLRNAPPQTVTLNQESDNDRRRVGAAFFDPDDVERIQVTTEDGRTFEKRGGFFLNADGSLNLDLTAMTPVAAVGSAPMAGVRPTWSSRGSRFVPGAVDLTLYGGYGFAASDPMASSEVSGGPANKVESGIGRLGGAKFGGKIRMGLPESIVQIPNVWVLIGGETFFDREAIGGEADNHPSIPDGNNDTSTRVWLEYALDFALGYTLPCPLDIVCQVGLSVGASLVATGLEGKSDETSGGGQLETFKDWNKHVAPFLGVWVYHPLGEFAGVPLNLVAGSDFRYIPMSGASGQSSTFGSSVNYNFISEGFWDIDPYIGLNVALSDFIPCVLGF